MMYFYNNGGIILNTDKIITFSIAAYNVSKVIRQCLDSFLSSKYLDKIEIIVVNDGSKDNTVEIVNEYINKYPKSIFLVDKKNGGHGSTINTAISIATGKYFKVLDGDDWVEASELDKLIDVLLNSDSDLVLDDYRCVYPGNNYRCRINGDFAYDVVYNVENVILTPAVCNCGVHMHSISIKTDLIQKYSERLSEHRFYVDTEFNFFVMSIMKTFQYSDSCTYQYRLGDNGQSVSPEGIYNHLEDMIFVMERLVKLYARDEKNIAYEARKKFLSLILSSICSFAIHMTLEVVTKKDKNYKLLNSINTIKAQYPNIVPLCNQDGSRAVQLVWKYNLNSFLYNLLGCAVRLKKGIR